MKSCGDIRDAVVRGETLADAETKAHLAVCPACAALAENPDPFKAALDLGTPASDQDVAKLLPSITRRIAEDRGAKGWIASRPTWMRVGIAGMAAATIVFAVLLLAPRSDLRSYPIERMMAIVTALGALVALSVSLALRPAFKPSPPPSAHYGFMGAAIAALIVIALLPAPGHAGAATDRGSLIGGAIPCFNFGVLLAVPIYVLLRVLDRGTHPLAAIAGATTAGVTANLALHVHCPNSGSAHLLAGHVTVAVVLVLIAMGFERRKRRS